MAHLVHRAPSVGSVLKKIMAIHPDLTAQEGIDIIRRSTRLLGAGEFATAEVVDEERALALTRAMLNPAQEGRDPLGALS